MAEDTIAEAPGEITGADEKPEGNLTVDDLAASFAERVEESPESEPTEPEAAEDSTPETVEAEEEQESDLSQLDDASEEAESEAVEDEPPKAVGKLLKQVNKLTARAKAAEEAAEAMKVEIQHLKTQPVETQAEPTGQPDLDDVKDFQSLNKLRQEALAAKRWALMHVGKDYVEADGKEYEGDEIRNILTQAEDYLSEKIPQRAQFLQQKQRWDEDTSSTFPWLAEQEGELYETFVNIRNGVQYASLLESLPNADFVAATLARGIEAIKADQAAAQKPKTKAKAKSPPPTSEGDAAVPAATSKQRQKKRKDAILGGSNVTVDQLTAYLAD